ncbi:TolC family outer membrane protein [Sterolibacterium denitrificans]|nr:TolC family outer membrane protein [Sterolibacterium denitrificans]
MRAEKYRPWLAGMALSLYLCSLPTTAEAADLLDIYHQAQASDPTFAAARHALEATQQRLPQARAGLLPVISASSGETRTQADVGFNNAPTEQRNTRNRNWAVQLTQPLFRIQNIHAYAEAQATVEQAVAQFGQAQQDLILRAAQAYFDVAVAEETIGVADAQVNALSEQWTLTKRSFKAGTRAQTDVHEALSRLGVAKAQRVAAQNDLEVRQAELEKLIGSWPDALAKLGATAEAPHLEPATPREWIAQAWEHHPVVLTRQAALTAAEATIRKNRAEHLPTLDFTVSYGSNSASGSLTTPADYTQKSAAQTAGLQLTVPLFAGGATHARVTEAIARRYQAAADLEAARRQAATEARQAFAGVVNGLAQTEALASAVESGQIAVEGNRRGYRVGIRINADVLNAEQQLYAAQRDWTKARYDTLLQGLKLKAAAGVLDEADLVAINRLLQAR